MARELRAGFQCEYMTVVATGRRERCAIKHHERIDGKPQQLLPVKKEGKTAFMCKDHAQYYTPAGATRKQKKTPPGAEQVSLL